jgi:hypothetical protein
MAVAAVCMDRKREHRTVAAFVFQRIGRAAFLTFLDILDTRFVRSSVSWWLIPGEYSHDIFVRWLVMCESLTEISRPAAQPWEISGASLDLP